MEKRLTHRIVVGVHCRDALLACGIVAVLNREADFNVLADGEPLHERLDVLVADTPALALWPLAGGPEQRRPRLLLYSTSRREQELRDALAAGVQGLVGRGCGLEELADAVRALHRGGRYFDVMAARQAAESLASEALTQRELQVLDLLARGQCNKTIASQLAVTLGTVKAHVGAILSKLQVDSRTQAARVATQRGLVQSTWDASDDACQPLRRLIAARQPVHG